MYVTQEQVMMRKMVRDFARKEIAPAAEIMETTDEFPFQLIEKMGKHGLMGIPVPERYGGAGADVVSYILAIHEISKISAAVGVILSVHTSVGTNPILYFGNEEQKMKYIPNLASGEHVGAFALTEPHSGSDAGSLRTTAIKKNGKYLLNGSKIFITNGGAADIYITFALTAQDQGRHGISAFIVEKNTPGFTVGKKERKLGLYGSNTTELMFDNAEVPEENLLGKEGDGFHIAMANLNVGRIGIAAQALGITEAALDHAVNYAKQRVQFGRPIAANQGISFKLADMATRAEAARHLVYNAADLHNRGLACGKEASMAKQFASDTAVKAALDAVQIFGGYGYMKDYPVERLLRDAKVTQIYEGTNEIQRLIISKHLLDGT
ncbi:acyl-CoA dehydrogenase [Bacillus tequilensis]|uniref:acyl-CoA dehydrogenase n=1 Tax=Bacillus tequilensis TaxID=227866 RepID=UPI000464ED60|nr:acyl-CoA dehydrogenase [Bacillus tequilensis]MDR4435642.1 acyl-CoA dehydrogenase [Bacillus tequilensis]SPU05034.1 short chain acyl-CoA dehydrogenase [Bacillus tequilensis]